MFCMEQSSCPPSLKLPLMDDIAKLLQNQDTVVRPGPSSSTSLHIGQFVPNPPNCGDWYPVAGEKFEQRPQVAPQAFSNIARPGYKGLPTASINLRELVKLELMFRDVSRPPTSSLPCLQPVNIHLTISELQGSRGKRPSDYWPQNQTRQLEISPSNRIPPPMQFMLDISRSTAVAYQHPLETFLHLLTNLVLIHQDAYLKNTHNSLNTYRFKNLQAVPISGPDLFERSLMQEYEQHLLGLGIKTGNQQSSIYYP